MLNRWLTPRLLEAWKDRPVVLLQGARQTGKSTLVQGLAKELNAQYLTLDQAPVLAAATADPDGFIAGLDGPVVLDEVQHAPELFRAIKASVDRDRRAGRFLLTGSANVLVTPKAAESLAGRIETQALWPLSQGEIEGVTETFIDKAFSAKPRWSASPHEDWAGIARRIVRGGYPEIVTQTRDARRNDWYASYVTTILQRDVRDMANIEGLTDLPRLLSLLATRAAGLLNFADVSRGLSMPQSTLKRYMALLEATFLVQTLPAWSTHMATRLAKAPKLLINDGGFLCHLLGCDARRLTGEATLAGPVMENFVATELLKQIAWSQANPRMFHFRTPPGQEVDLVLEGPGGEIVGIDVRTAATVEGGDWRGMKLLAEIAGKRFVRGVVLYTGREVVPFAANMHAVPAAALWTA